MIVDTSVLLAWFDADEPDHQAISLLMTEAREPLIVSPYVVAEVDYLVSTRFGVDRELAVLRELAGGAWDLASLADEELLRCAAIVERYRDQRIGMTDASIVVMAARFGTRRIATLDRRHFDVLRPIDGGRFAVVP